jgi:putative membrane protein
MKKLSSVLAMALLTGMVYSCGNNDSADTATTSTTETTTTNTAGDTSGMGTGTNTTAATPAMNATPLNREDSMFVMEAAMGGMMEVESSRMAQNMATNPRVKAFAEMMIRDHSNANTELKSLASAKGMMLPDSMPKKMQDHMAEMQKMKGSAFDKHYVSMMRNDHKKDISKFEKAANSAADADLKNWAAKTLPTLKMHRDSVDALSKMKM